MEVCRKLFASSPELLAHDTAESRFPEWTGVFANIIEQADFTGFSPPIFRSKVRFCPVLLPVE